MLTGCCKSTTLHHWALGFMSQPHATGVFLVDGISMLPMCLIEILEHARLGRSKIDSLRRFLAVACDKQFFQGCSIPSDILEHSQL
jgi:hypothetical protein